MAPEKECPKVEARVSVETTIEGDQSLGYETVSKLVSTLVDLKDDGFYLQVKLIGKKKDKK
jgi:hypothetical protein